MDKHGSIAMVVEPSGNPNFALYEYLGEYYQIWTTKPTNYTVVASLNYSADSAKADCTGLVALWAYNYAAIGDYYYTTSSSMASTLAANGYTLVATWYAFNSNPGNVTVNGVQYTPIAIYNANNTSSGLNAFGNLTQINALNSSWTKYTSAAAFWLI